MSGIYNIINYLTEELKSAILSNYSVIDYITEIRIRLNKPIVVYVYNTPHFISFTGRFISMYGNDVLIVNDTSFFEIIDRLCNSSFHTNIETMKNGYIITKDGARIGISSKAVYRENSLSGIKDITSINIRIPHECKNCSRSIINELNSGSNLPSIIVASQPSMGKTTFLRDYARIISSGYNGKYRKVSIVDERCEISADFDVGINTDVICNFSKAKGIEMAIRSLSPELIVCDEIGTKDELESIKFGFASGVGFAVSVHHNGKITNDESILNGLIKCNCFDYLIYLKHYTQEYSIYSLKEDNCEGIGSNNDNNMLNINRRINKQL